jgi:hypothetical protein
VSAITLWRAARFGWNFAVGFSTGGKLNLVPGQGAGVVLKETDELAGDHPDHLPPKFFMVIFDPSGWASHD